MEGRSQQEKVIGDARVSPESTRLPGRIAGLFHTHHAWFWAGSLLVCLAGYADVVFGGRTFLSVGRTAGSYDSPPFAANYAFAGTPRAEIDPGAEAWQVHPWAYEEHRALARGELPLWNRHNGLGYPLLANGQTATLNPLHWMVLLDPDLPALWDCYFLLLRFIAALAGCYLLFALGTPPRFAVLGAPLGALNGALTVFVSRSDLAAHALLPVVLLFLVRLYLRPSFASAAALAAAMALCLTAGHPEPAFADLFIAGTVSLGLCAIPSQTKARYLGMAAAGAALAGLITAPYALPFLERVQQSWSIHVQGAFSSRVRPAYAALQWFAPNAFAHDLTGLFDDPLENMGFLGVVMTFLVCLRVLTAAALPRSWRTSVWLVGPLLVALRIHGARGTGWLARLPLLNRMPFDIYFTAGVLYCFGIGGILALSSLLQVPERRRNLLIAGAALLSLEALALACVYVPGGGAVLSTKWPLQLLIDGHLVFAATALCWISLTMVSTERRRGIGAIGLFVLVSAELTAYRMPLGPRGNPTSIPVYAKWLREKQDKEPPFRVMGLGLTMMPNYATAFGLDDLRLCDALVAPEYVQFLHRFLQKELVWQWFFTAEPSAGFKADNPILDWLNVRYLAVGNGLLTTPTRLESQLLAVGHPGWDNRTYIIDDTVHPLLYEHPNDEGSAQLRVPASYPILSFALAQDPLVWHSPGDGATYEIAISVPGSPPLTVFSEEIDPKNNPAHRHWMNRRVDLARWKGREIGLVLRARSGNTASDWGGWGDLHWESPSGAREYSDALATIGHLPVAYAGDAQATVLENPHAWPRVFATRDLYREADADRVLDRIQSLALPGAGPFAVTGPDFPAERWDALCRSGGCAPGVRPRLDVSALKYGSASMSFDAQLDGPSILTVNELLVPGWLATVDGRKEPIFRVNYLFRGLLLGPGKHFIHFEYWPRVWTLSFALAGIGWLIIAAGVALAWRRRLKTSTALAPGAATPAPSEAR